MCTEKHGKIRGIVLAGVHSWGESLLERICPRPLLPIAGRPLVWYGLEWLRRSGVRDITICANSDTAALRSCLRNGSTLGLTLDYYEDVMPRGPAGCIRDAALQSGDDLFVVVEGTVLPHVELEGALAAHRQSGSLLTILAVEWGSSGARPLMEPAGIYIASRSALELIPSKGYQDVKEMWIRRLYRQGGLCPFYPVRPGSAIRVRELGSYLGAAIRFLESLSVEESLESEYRRRGDAWVHRSARVADSARLTGPALIGPRAALEDGVAVAGPAIISPGTRIGAAAVLSNVVAWSRCEIGAGAFLTNCVLSAGSWVEPDTVVRDALYCPSSSPRLDDYWAMPPSSPVGPALL